MVDNSVLVTKTSAFSQRASARGVLVVGHGTRDAAGIAEFFATVRLVRERLEDNWPENRFPVEPCFLELAVPTIAEGLERLVSQGVEQVTVLPLLLFAAGHAKEDIPAAVAQAAARRPEIQFRQVPHLGCHPSVLALSAQRYREAIANRCDLPASETALLLVGRGSADDMATAEMRRFAQLRATGTEVGRMETCFLAMAQPSLAEALSDLAGQGFRRIVVQPHLLFGGLLLTDFRSTVQQWATERGDIEFVLTEHLGPSSLIAAAIVDRLKETADASSS